MCIRDRDYPAFFTRDDIFAFRTMFYWGHFISFTVHLQGVYATKYSSQLIEKLRGISEEKDIYFCVNDTPWEYLYKENNYRLLSSLKLNQINEQINKNSFVKLSCKLPISKIHQSSDYMMGFFKCIISSLSPEH